MYLELPLVDPLAGWRGWCGACTRRQRAQAQGERVVCVLVFMDVFPAGGMLLTCAADTCPAVCTAPAAAVNRLPAAALADLKAAAAAAAAAGSRQQLVQQPVQEGWALRAFKTANEGQVGGVGAVCVL